MLFRGGGGGKRSCYCCGKGAAAKISSCRNRAPGVPDQWRRWCERCGAESFLAKRLDSYNADTFRKASVYEGLADDDTRNPYPASVSLAPAKQGPTAVTRAIGAVALPGAAPMPPKITIYWKRLPPDKG